MLNIEKTRHKTIAVNGGTVFYREAGRRDDPVVLLLLGFPSSSKASGTS